MAPTDPHAAQAPRAVVSSLNEEILEQPGRRVAVESQLLLGHLSVILRWDQIARS